VGCFFMISYLAAGLAVLHYSSVVFLLVKKACSFYGVFDLVDFDSFPNLVKSIALFAFGSYSSSKPCTLYSWANNLRSSTVCLVTFWYRLIFSFSSL